jgi:hypothetical protein
MSNLPDLPTLIRDRTRFRDLVGFHALFFSL